MTPPALGPYGRVQTIEVSPHDPAKAYAAVLRYQVGDFAPHIYRTEDYGATWTHIANGIPDDEPVRVVREDPNREGLLYAGTEFGMFISFDDGDSWQPFQLNLPNTPITDLKVVGKDLALSTMGRSFWIMSNVTPLHEMSPDIAAAPGASVRRRRGHPFPRRRSWRRSGCQPRRAPVRAHRGHVRLLVRRGSDRRGDAGDLRRSGQPRGAVSPAARRGSASRFRTSPACREWRLERVGTPRLPSGAGMHRFVWDLRHAGPWSPGRGGRGGGGGGGGPMVPPGTYEARLTSGDWSASQTFDVVLDPRVAAEGITADVVGRQAAFALEVRDTLSNARLAAQKLREARTELEGAETDQAQALDDALEIIEREFIDEPYRYSPIMLLGQLQYLYGNLNSADQEPGRDAINRHDELAETLDGLIAELERLLSTMRDR